MSDLGVYASPPTRPASAERFALGLPARPALLSPRAWLVLLILSLIHI